MNTIIVDGETVTPSKVVCVGRNYVAHIEELGNDVPDSMVVFAKPNSAIGRVLHAERGEPLHYEGELCFAVRDGTFASVGFGLDLTRRTLQTHLKQRGLPWERAKAFDGAALFSAFVPFDDAAGLSLTLTVDEHPTQAGGVALMMYKPDSILAEIRRFMSLEDGDIVMTGTPEGVGPVTAGAEYIGTVLDGDKELVSARWVAR